MRPIRPILAQKSASSRSCILPSTAQCPPSRLPFALIRTQPCRNGIYLHHLFGATASHTAPVRSRISLCVREGLTYRRIVSSLGFYSAIFRPHPLFRVCRRTLAVAKPSELATLRRSSLRKHALSAHPPATCLPASSYLFRIKSYNSAILFALIASLAARRLSAAFGQVALSAKISLCVPRAVY